MDHGEIGRLNCIAYLLIGGRLGANRTGRDEHGQDREA
jgi:hypothetical protein